MAESDLKITTTINGDVKTIKMEILEDSFLPADIFLWTNDDGQLGEFQGVCNKAQLRRYRVWSEDPPVPSFGNRLVRYHEAIRVLGVMEDETRYVDIVLRDIQHLSIELQTEPVVTRVVKIL